jgi:hypothetical protein
MRTYKVKQNGFDELKKKITSRVLPLFGTMFAFVIFFNYPKNNGSSELILSLFTIVLVVGIMIYAWFRGMKKQKELFESFELTIDNDAIVRERKNTPAIRVERSGIKEILKTQNGSIIIKAGRKVDFIWIPAQMENMAELEQVLNSFVAIKLQSEKTLLDKYGTALPFLSLLLMAIVYSAKNKYVVLTAGGCLIAFLTWSVIILQTSKNIDSRLKRSSYWSILVIAALIAAMIAKLME